MYLLSTTFPNAPDLHPPPPPPNSIPVDKSLITYRTVVDND